MDEEFSIDDKIKIIGNESQTIHIILEKNKKININKNSIIYASSENLEEIVYKKTDILIRNNSLSLTTYKEKELKKVENEQIVRLRNLENNIEYIGLSKGGRIMKCTPLLYTNLFIRIDNILAFNDGIEILYNKEVDGKIFKINQNNFVIRNMSDKFKTKENEFCVVKSKLSKSKLRAFTKESLSLFNINSYINDYIYISGTGSLIEKRLGENETMSLVVNSIIAFEESVNFTSIKKGNNNLKYLNSFNDIIVEGPGLIIFENTGRRITLTNSKRNKIFVLIIICLFILQIITIFFSPNFD
jgi:uncharacterized protein (AIM24 family)